MTVAGSIRDTSCTWRALLPADRTFVALPSRSHPVIIAEWDTAVLRYVRQNLLARPPGSQLPGWLYQAAGPTLRLRGMWRLAPRLHPMPRLRSGTEVQVEPAEKCVLAWLDSIEHRVIVLDHSRDPDGSFILLLFPPASAEPTIAVKVPTCAAAAARVGNERDRFRQLELEPLGTVRETIPRLIEIEGLPALATTAQPGVSMLVRYYRAGHSGCPAAVRTDFAAAGAWLTALQSTPTGPRVALDVAQSTIDAAQVQLAGRPEQLNVALGALAGLRRSLRHHQVTSTVVHGDFWLGNILTRDGVVTGVVDWERAAVAGDPVRDVARFAVSYSLYLDRHTRTSRPVAGHSGLLGRAPGGGVRYVIDGHGWYSLLVRGFMGDALQRLGLPPSLAADVMRAELAAIAAEATEPGFCRDHWQMFTEVCAGYR